MSLLDYLTRKSIIYDSDGYDAEGYDEAGFNREGRDRNGFDQNGLDKDGYNKHGIGKNGVDREGFDINGFDENGYNRDGFNEKGFNSEGYDSDGFNEDGFNKDGFSRLGVHQREYNKHGYHKTTGLDPFGYDEEGYNTKGFNKYSHRDRLGADENGLDENGYDIWGFNIEKGKSIHGISIDEYEYNTNFSEELCENFKRLYNDFIIGNYKYAWMLAECYYEGKGTVCNYRKMLVVLFEAAIHLSNNKEILDIIATIFSNSSISKADKKVSDYLSAMANGGVAPYFIFCSNEALDFSYHENDNEASNILEEERKHLANVIASIDRQIEENKNGMYVIEDIPLWMMGKEDKENKEEYQRMNASKERQIQELSLIRKDLYHARIDLAYQGVKKTHYVGERAYVDFETSENSISSIWSDVGKAFRDQLKTSYIVGGVSQDIILRRNFDIVEDKLLNVYDGYVASKEQGTQITDTYLSQILKRKRGEKNISNIIRSIQYKQNTIIEEALGNNIIVQGCAGSGKTMVLLHRLANLKYNNPSYSWNNVKIITPNPRFAFYLDDLSQNLGIEEIERITIQDYYLILLERYQSDHPAIKSNSGRTCFNCKKERKNLIDDAMLDTSIVNFVYSDAFADSMKSKIQLYKANHQNTYFDRVSSYEAFWEVLTSIFKENGIKEKIYRESNFFCILYAKVLCSYYMFGPVSKSEQLLCVDEGQDICENQYKLIYNANAQRVKLNIYGDLNQRLNLKTSIPEWTSLKNAIGARYYELDENFRNSEEIVNYYNNVLNTSDRSFGISVKDIHRFNMRDLEVLVKLHLVLGNRVVIITQDLSKLPSGVRAMCSSNNNALNKASAMTVRQAKGLEFDVSFVLDEGMAPNEKYVAYTRALSELYIHKATDVPLYEIINHEPPKLAFLERIKREKAERERIEQERLERIAKEQAAKELAEKLAKEKEEKALREKIEFELKQKFEREFNERLNREKIRMESEIIAQKEREFKYRLETERARIKAELISQKEQTERQKIEQRNRRLASLNTLSDFVSEYKLPLILVRNGWSNDFCFVAESIDESSGTVSGKQYLQGAFHASKNYTFTSGEWGIYKGASLKRIQNIYNGNSLQQLK